MLRTEKFNKVIERIGSKYKKLITLVSYISILVGVYLLAVGIYFIHVNLLAIIFKSPTAAPVAPVLPGITIGLESLPYFVLAAAIVLIPHEFAHGIFASAFNISIKSAGLLLAIILFGGFVEPDENEFEEISLSRKIRVFSAGSFANFLTFILLILVFTNAMIASGVLVNSTLEGYPANEVLRAGDIIIKMNETEVKSLQELIVFMKNTKPGDVVELTVVRNGDIVNVHIRLVSDPRNSTKGFMGASFNDFYSLVFFRDSFSDLARSLSTEVYKILIWSIMATQSIAVINMLPIYPFDGGQVVNAVIEKFIKNEKNRTIAKVSVSIYFAAILLANMILSIKIWGLRLWLP
ncbi:MAG: hypothetical protein B6U95_01925 [Thermofilum sp. ex4484_82]|nr:MAG: hypothetical protein B6U95_01925 [Thermofilum sp. ex4484_82]OYT39455.1 MAG: hypothetical protein B6U96_01930 [Archaeoglobales archaeon ex4484_92]